MKIIYLIPGTYRAAGMERVLSLKAHALTADNPSLEIVIVTTDRMGRPSVFGLDDFRQIDLGVNYEATNGKPFIIKAAAYPFKHLLHRIRLRKVLMREKADIVVSMFANDADIVPGIKDGSRKILEVHFSRFKKLQYARRGLWAVADKWRTRSDVRTAARYDSFVTLTEEDRAYWDADYDAAGLCRNSLCIPNPRTFAPQDVPSTVKDGKMVLAVGRYTHQKGFDMLLDAWEKVCGQCGGWTLRIAGDGEDRAALQEQAGRLGIEGSVVFGPADDIKQLYAQASLFVFSSRYEGFGLALTEAQAAGVPMISFSCKCGPSEIITDLEGSADNADGILVPEKDVDALASALLRLMGDEGLRDAMSRNALKNSERFSMESIMERWNKLFGL